MDQSDNNNRFPQPPGSEKTQGSVDNNNLEKEKYLRDAGKIEDLPEETSVPKMKSDPVDDADADDEGHTREWADRGRVVMDTKEDLSKNSSPNQSPSEDEDVEEKSDHLRGNSDPAY